MRFETDILLFCFQRLNGYDILDHFSNIENMTLYQNNNLHINFKTWVFSAEPVFFISETAFVYSEFRKQQFSNGITQYVLT